LAKKLLVK